MKYRETYTVGRVKGNHDGVKAAFYHDNTYRYRYSPPVWYYIEVKDGYKFEEVAKAYKARCHYFCNDETSRNTGSLMF